MNTTALLDLAELALAAYGQFNAETHPPYLANSPT